MLYALKPVVQLWHAQSPQTCWCTYPGLYQAWAGKVIQTTLPSSRLIAPLHPVQEYWQQEALTLKFIHQHSTSQACCGYHELKFQPPLHTPLQMEIAWSTAHNCSCILVSTGRASRSLAYTAATWAGRSSSRLIGSQKQEGSFSFIVCDTQHNGTLWLVL